MNAAGVAELDLTAIYVRVRVRAPETGVHLGVSLRCETNGLLTWLHPQFAQLPTASFRGGCLGCRAPVMGLIFLPLAAARFVESSTVAEEAPLRRWRRAGPLLEEREVFLAIAKYGPGCDGRRGRVMMWSVGDGNDARGRWHGLCDAQAKAAEALVQNSETRLGLRAAHNEHEAGRSTRAGDRLGVRSVAG